jgi:hypothetical protein
MKKKRKKKALPLCRLLVFVGSLASGEVAILVVPVPVHQLPSSQDPPTTGPPISEERVGIAGNEE